MTNLGDMPTYIRAIVTDEEKENVKSKAKQLGLNESQLIRLALAKMGVSIESEKAIGVSTGTANNPTGKGGHGRLSEETKTAIRADYKTKMSWKDLVDKYKVSSRTISIALEEEK